MKIINYTYSSFFGLVYSHLNIFHLEPILLKVWSLKKMEEITEGLEEKLDDDKNTLIKVKNPHLVYFGQTNGRIEPLGVKMNDLIRSDNQESLKFQYWSKYLRTYGQMKEGNLDQWGIVMKEDLKRYFLIMAFHLKTFTLKTSALTNREIEKCISILRSFIKALEKRNLFKELENDPSAAEALFKVLMPEMNILFEATYGKFLVDTPISPDIKKVLKRDFPIENEQNGNCFFLEYNPNKTYKNVYDLIDLYFDILGLVDHVAGDESIILTEVNIRDLNEDEEQLEEKQVFSNSNFAERKSNNSHSTVKIPETYKHN